jgi:hypothetical protein
MWSCLPSSGDRRTAVGTSRRASVSHRDSSPSALRRVVGHHPMNAPDRRGRRSNEVSHLKARAVLLGLLALFVVSGGMTSVASASPFFHVANSKLPAGTVKQIKLQLKSKAAVLSAAGLGEGGLEVECKNSGSEGATIENGAGQGQGKGRVTYSTCKVLKPTKECFVAEPITTHQIKSYLAEESETGSKNFLEVFEPTEGSVFVELHFKGSGCGVLSGGPQPVDGSIAAEVIPKEAEGQEGLINFPSTAITVVKHETRKTPVGLTIGASKTAATFSAAYGAQLAEFPTKFGVFLN